MELGRSDKQSKCSADLGYNRWWFSVCWYLMYLCIHNICCYSMVCKRWTVSFIQRKNYPRFTQISVFCQFLCKSNRFFVSLLVYRVLKYAYYDNIWTYYYSVSYRWFSLNTSTIRTTLLWWFSCAYKNYWIYNSELFFLSWFINAKSLASSDLNNGCFWRTKLLSTILTIIFSEEVLYIRFNCCMWKFILHKKLMLQYFLSIILFFTIR